MPVENIGRYQIISELGKGAMGVVYKATDPNIGRTVALKTLRLDLEGTESEELLRRFKNEARAAGVLNHPNIVTIYDAGEVAGLFYIAMEFIEGATLQQMLKRQPMQPADKMIEIVRQVCAGLDFAHSKGIIHRDIKPANIMLLPDDTAKIMDFGIAKTAGSGMTSTGQVLGTPNYMSPEQVKGQTLDGRSDLFSLGVVMYEMLTGERPFTGQNVTTIIYKIVNEQPSAPHALDMTMHPGLSAVIMKALAKAPDQRYQDGASLAKDLANYKGYVPTTGANMPQVEPGATVIMPIPPPALEVASAAAAAAKAAPAAIPSLQSTVSRPRPAAPVPPRKTSSPITGVVVAVAAMVLAVGGYFGVRSMRSGTTPPAAVETSKPAPQPQETPEAQPATATEAATATAPELAAPSAAPPPAVVPQTGDLRVSSSPAGAQVKIDGRSDPKWVTPFTAAKLKLGAHTVAFAKDGYKPETRKVEVAAGKKAVANAELLPVIRPQPAGPPAQQQAPAAGTAQSPSGEQQQSGGANPFRKIRRFFGGSPQDKGTLELRTRPRGAAIVINGTVTPLRTPVKVPLPPGKYRIALRLPGFKPIIRNVDVEKGKSYGVEEILEKQ